MSVDSQFGRLISELGQLLGIPALAPSEEGICQLVFDGRHVVQVLHMRRGDQVLLSCRLAEHAIDPAQAERMARANFLQAGHGVVLCVAPDGRPHMQVACPLAECSGAALCPMLEGLLDQADSWGHGMTRGHGSTGGPPDPAMLLQSV